MLCRWVNVLPLVLAMVLSLASAVDQTEAIDKCCSCLAESVVETDGGQQSCLGTTSTVGRTECTSLIADENSLVLSQCQACQDKCRISCADLNLRCGDTRSDAGISSDSRQIGSGGVGDPCPCLAELVEVGSPCTCRERCNMDDPLPRCPNSDSEACAILGYALPDGGRLSLDIGACMPTQGPGQKCSPEPCGETLVCARLSGQIVNTCRYLCDPSADGGCPENQSCLQMPQGGACF